MPEPFRSFTSRVVPIRAENVDTDQIVPARYLKVTDKEGLADALFRDWRFNEDGTKQGPAVHPRPARVQGRKILLAGDNFGTGTSREHAPWALAAWGSGRSSRPASPTSSGATRSRTACCRSSWTPRPTSGCWTLVEADPDVELRVDLAEQGILLPDGSTLDFEVDPFSKLMLLPAPTRSATSRRRTPRSPPGRPRNPPRVDTRLGIAAG